MSSLALAFQVMAVPRSVSCTAFLLCLIADGRGGQVRTVTLAAPTDAALQAQAVNG
ncbi:MAG: hypothetical protein KA914_01030 [Ottowia sp.]|nr:hypothetical protein [Ottowia sp.]